MPFTIRICMHPFKQGRWPKVTSPPQLTVTTGLSLTAGRGQERERESRKWEDKASWARGKSSEVLDKVGLWGQALGRQRQVGFCEFKTSLFYLASSKPVTNTWDPHLNKNKIKKVSSTIDGIPVISVAFLSLPPVDPVSMPTQSHLKGLCESPKIPF